MDAMRTGGGDENREAIVTLALEHHLVSKYTSLVAVDVTPVRPKGAGLDAAAMPTNLPQGWEHSKVFGELPQTATPKTMHLLVALVALLLAGVLVLLQTPKLAGFMGRGDGTGPLGNKR
jgi:Ca-activated chloride channel family protein